MEIPGGRSRLRRRIAEVGVAVSLLAPTATPVLASPSPSPSLEGLLTTPTSGSYVRDSTLFTPIQGNFDAVDYLGVLTPRKPSETLATLTEDGFLKGYGRSWVDPTAHRLLVEIVVAFGGGAGAGRWLPEAKNLSQDSEFFKNEFAVSGIDAAFGGHFENPAAPAYVDQVGFVKGNDYFFVYLYSPKNDLADAARKQARQQYDAAPAQTVAPAQWPENASNNSSRTSLSISPTAIAIGAGGVAFVLIAVLLALIFLISRGRRTRRDEVPGDFQMSADGHYWWDGAAWKSAAEAAPPAAQRSADGGYWWDGARWRQMPRGPQPAPASPQEPSPS